jgi:hypothetical protein
MWQSFYSRSSCDLNQPYIHLCIRTIINHCGNDFNIILIDDNAFNKLIPSWDIDMQKEANKSHLRELGLAELIYYYGGMVVPNTFVCKRNLISLYLDAVSNNNPFVCENINRTVKKTAFIPDSFFIGSTKNNTVVRDYADFLKKRISNPHVSLEPDFLGETSQFFIAKINNGEMNLIQGEMVGVKDKNGKHIGIENLFEEDYLELCRENYGIYIDEAMVLNRNKYNWFCVMSADDILNQPIYISKFIINSLVELKYHTVTNNNLTSLFI